MLVGFSVVGVVVVVVVVTGAIVRMIFSLSITSLIVKDALRNGNLQITEKFIYFITLNELFTI